MADIEKTEFKFPDEDNEVQPSAVNASDEVEIEVIDDTPEEDRGRTPMKEAPADVTDDELSQYSEGVKKRIQHFSKGYHEERRAKETAQREKEEALRIAQAVVEENKALQKSIDDSRKIILEREGDSLKKEIEEARANLKLSYEAGDSSLMVDWQEHLSNLRIKADRLEKAKEKALQDESDVVKTSPDVSRVEPAAYQIDQKAEAWRKANPWFMVDKDMTDIALNTHNKLVKDGVDTSSDEYYEKLNSRVRQVFPDAFPSERSAKKSTVVASATRSTAPRKIVLTQSQVSIAKRLGVPLELYAKQVAEQSRK